MAELGCQSTTAFRDLSGDASTSGSCLTGVSPLGPRLQEDRGRIEQALAVILSCRQPHLRSRAKQTLP